jgi:hypothetical protein
MTPRHALIIGGPQLWLRATRRSGAAESRP